MISLLPTGGLEWASWCAPGYGWGGFQLCRVAKGPNGKTAVCQQQQGTEWHRMAPANQMLLLRFCAFSKSCTKHSEKIWNSTISCSLPGTRWGGWGAGPSPDLFMEGFFFAFFVCLFVCFCFPPWPSGFFVASVAFVGVWLLWLYHALPVYLSI